MPTAMASLKGGRGEWESHRTILLYGKKAPAITLPKKWVVLQNLRPGDKVRVTVSPDGSLVVRPLLDKSSPSSRELFIDARNAPFRFLVREVIAAYLAGFNKIKVAGSRSEILRPLKRILETVVLGLIVLDEGEESMTFYTVVDPRSMNFWDALRQEFRVASRMLSLALEGIRRSNMELLDTVVETDTVVDKLYLYVSRMIISTLAGERSLGDLSLSTPAELPVLFLAAKSIERVADHAVIISSNAGEIVKSGGSLGEIGEVFSQAVEYFKRVGRALVYSADTGFENLFDAPEETMKLSVNSIPEARILDSTRRIIRYSLDIAESVVQLDMIRRVSRGKM